MAKDDSSVVKKTAEVIGKTAAHTTHAARKAVRPVTDAIKRSQERGVQSRKLRGDDRGHQIKL